jgi:hypothetical protein
MPRLLRHRGQRLVWRRPDFGAFQAWALERIFIELSSPLFWSTASAMMQGAAPLASGAPASSELTV